MDISILRRTGLTESQAKGYLALVENGKMSPAQLAEHIGETRTNTYAVADKLTSLGLVTRTDEPKIVYSPNHPSALETLAEKRRRIITKNEEILKQNISPLIDSFYAATQTPGSRSLQGLDGIREVYEDVLRDGKDVYVLRTRSDTPHLGAKFFADFHAGRVKRGINSYILTPSGLDIILPADDKKMLFHRTIMPESVYNAPVEISVYGDKVAFISFSETQMATIIQSPTIAEALRQVIIFIQKTLRQS
jgi:sugar-specific transcriptional regulator TrmB